MTGRGHGRVVDRRWCRLMGHFGNSTWTAITSGVTVTVCPKCCTTVVLRDVGDTPYSPVEPSSWPGERDTAYRGAGALHTAGTLFYAAVVVVSLVLLAVFAVRWLVPTMAGTLIAYLIGLARSR